MPLALPDEPDTWQQDIQYLLGPSLMVAPVVRERDVPLDTIPLFGLEGHLLPLGPVVQHTGELPAPLTVDEVLTFGTPTVSFELTVPGGTAPTLTVH